MSALSAVKFTGPLGKFTWRMLATVLGGQAISVALGAMVARGIAMADGHPSPDMLLWVGLGLSVLCIVAAGLIRTTIGLPLGWVCQVLTIAAGFIVPMMFIVGVIFLGLWVLCLVQGAKIEALMAQREAAGANG